MEAPHERDQLCPKSAASAYDRRYGQLARKLNPHTQLHSRVYSCKRFAAWLKRSPDTATPDEVRRAISAVSSSRAVRASVTRNRIMTGVRFLFRVTLRIAPHDLAAEVWHIKEAAEAAASAEP